MTRKRLVRVLLTLAVTGGCLAYILWQLNVTARQRTSSSTRISAGSRAPCFVMLAGVPPMAYRWQKLLEARGIRERLSWLIRSYLVSYTAGQVLPTAVGGDASRIYESARRHPGQVRRPDGDRPARARARRRRDARPRCDRLRARGRPLRRRRLSLDRGSVRRRHDRPRDPVLLAPRARAAAPFRSAAAPPAHRAAAARPLRRRARLPPARAADGVDLAADARRAGGARAGDLDGRPRRSGSSSRLVPTT